MVRPGAHLIAWQSYALAVSQRRLQACLLQPVTLDAAAGVQALAYGINVVLALGSVNIAPPAAKPLLTSLAKVFATAGVPNTLLPNTALLVSRAGSCSIPVAWAADASRACEISCGSWAETACDLHIQHAAERAGGPGPRPLEFGCEHAGGRTRPASRAAAIRGGAAAAPLAASA